MDDSKQRLGRLTAKLAHVASRQGNHARVLALVRSASETANLDPVSTATLEARAALSLCAQGELREAVLRRSASLPVCAD